MTSLDVGLSRMYACENADPFWVLHGFVSGVHVSDATSMLLILATFCDAAIPGLVLSRMA